MKEKQVAVVMGSQSDWNTMKESISILKILEIKYECKIVSAHRTPDRLFSFASNAQKNGLNVIVAGAGGAAHLPGMIASKTLIPVIGVPIKTKILAGVDSLYSIVQMPRGYPVATMAIGPTGASNAALMAASILALDNPEIEENLRKWKEKLALSVPMEPQDK